MANNKDFSDEELEAYKSDQADMAHDKWCEDSYILLFRKIEETYSEAMVDGSYYKSRGNTKFFEDATRMLADICKVDVDPPIHSLKIKEKK